MWEYTRPECLRKVRFARCQHTLHKRLLVWHAGVVHSTTCHVNSLAARQLAVKGNLIPIKKRDIRSHFGPLPKSQMSLSTHPATLLSRSYCISFGCNQLVTLSRSYCDNGSSTALPTVVDKQLSECLSLNADALEAGRRREQSFGGHPSNETAMFGNQRGSLFQASPFQGGRFNSPSVGIVSEPFVSIYANLASGDVRAMVEAVEWDCSAVPEEKLLATHQWGTALHAAALSGNDATLQAIVKAFPEKGLLERDSAGQTALHAVCATRFSKETVGLFLSRMPGDAFTITSFRGILPLHLACGGTLFEAVKERTPAELHSARTSTGANALHFAVAKRCRATVEALLTSLPEESFTERDGRGYSPLMKAIMAGSSIGVLMVLINASSSSVLSQQCLHGSVPLEAALQQTAKPVVSRALLRLIDRCEELQVLSECKNNPLHLACALGRQDIIDRVARLELAKEWASTPREGSFALMAIVKRSCFTVGGTMNDISAVAAVTPLEGFTQPCAATGETPLHFAVRKEGTAAAILLQKLPPKALLVEDKDGHTPLSRCLASGHASNVMMETVSDILRVSGECTLLQRHWSLLKNCKIPPDVLTKVVGEIPPGTYEHDTREAWEGSWTPMHAAFTLRAVSNVFGFANPMMGNARRPISRAEVEVLLSSLPHWFLTVKSSKGHTPLHMAVTVDAMDVLELLMDIQEAEEAVLMQPTPLETAVRESNLQAVRLLVGKGPPGLADIPSASGMTLVDLNDSMDQRTPAMKATVEAIRKVLHPGPKSAAEV